MAGCIAPGRHLSEYEFVRALNARDPADLHACAGPLVLHSFTVRDLIVVQTAFQSSRAHELLWRNFAPRFPVAMRFKLCLCHWLDLAGLVSLHGHQLAEPEWVQAASRLALLTITASGYDPKEVGNFLAGTDMNPGR